MSARLPLLVLALAAGGLGGWLLMGVVPDPEPPVALPDEGLVVMGGCLGDAASHGVDPVTGQKRPPYAPNRAPTPPAWVRNLGPYGESVERPRFFTWINARPVRLLDYLAWIALHEEALARSPAAVFERTQILFVGASPQLDPAAGLLACELEAEQHGPRFLAAVLGLLKSIDASPTRRSLRGLVAREGAALEVRRLAAGVLLGLRPVIQEDVAAAAPLLATEAGDSLPGLEALLRGLRLLPAGQARTYLPTVLALEDESLGPDEALARLGLLVAVAPHERSTLVHLAQALQGGSLAMRQFASRTMFPDQADPAGRAAWAHFLRQAPLGLRVAYARESVRLDPTTGPALAANVLPALVDDDPDTRDEAAALLGRMGAPAAEVLPGIESLVASGESSRLVTAAKALAAMGERDEPHERVFPLLDQVARMASTAARLAAVDGLAALPSDARSRALLAHLLRDEARAVRAKALEVLSDCQLDGADGVAELIKSAARDDDPLIRARVREILDRIAEDE